MRAITCDAYELVRAEPRKDRASTRTSRAFWVLLDDSGPVHPFTLPLPDGRAAIAVFSSEEEAKMFCHFRKRAADLSVRETSTGEILSLLYCPWCAAKHVALDPLPEVLGDAWLLELLTLDRHSFDRHFASGFSTGGILP